MLATVFQFEIPQVYLLFIGLLSYVFLSYILSIPMVRHANSHFQDQTGTYALCAWIISPVWVPITLLFFSIAKICRIARRVAVRVAVGKQTYTELVRVQKQGTRDFSSMYTYIMIAAFNLIAIGVAAIIGISTNSLEIPILYALTFAFLLPITFCTVIAIQDR